MQSADLSKVSISAYVKANIAADGVKKLNKMYEHAKKEYTKLSARMQQPAAGEMLTYEITPTTLGDVYQVKCNACDKVVDLTDYKSW